MAEGFQPREPDLLGGLGLALLLALLLLLPPQLPGHDVVKGIGKDLQKRPEVLREAVPRAAHA